MNPGKTNGKAIETNSLWPFYSLMATVLRRFGVIFLGMVVVISGIVIAHQTHQMRQTTIALKQLEDEQTALELQWQKLSLEQSSLAEHSRVESLAEKRLQMKQLDSRNEVLITPSVRGRE